MADAEHCVCIYVQNTYCLLCEAGTMIPWQAFEVLHADTNKISRILIVFAEFAVVTRFEHDNRTGSNSIL